MLDEQRILIHYGGGLPPNSTVRQSFDTSSSYRFIQTLALTNVSTSHATITILSSVNGGATGGQQQLDKVMLSEVPSA
ncbi:MAG: hypothetical protein ACRDTG_19960 [Pseudonocardiaceae bacterium]